MNKTIVLSGVNYDNAYKKCIKEIDLKIKDLKDQNSIFMNKDKKIFYLDSLSDSLQCISFDSKISSLISSCLVNDSIKIFKTAPFFSNFSILYSVEMMKILSMSSDSIDFKKLEKELIGLIQESSEITTKKSIVRFIKDATQDKLSQHVINEAFETAGLSGKVFFEDNSTKNSTIETKDAYVFDIETFNEFFFDKNTWSHELVSVIVIDGIIENVAEINNILEQASKSIEPMIIVARGFADDVLQTLYVNMQRKSLNVLPLKLLNYENAINDFVDISVVSKTDPVSYLKGDLISKIDYDEISIVEKVEIRSGKITIINNAAKHATRIHLEKIRRSTQEKRKLLDASGIELLDRVAAKRMKSLGGRSIHVHPSENYNSRNLRFLKIEIDSAFRSIPIARDFGMVEVSSLIKSLRSSSNFEALADVLDYTFSGYKKIPVGSLIRCAKACHSNAMLLNETSGALIDEKFKKD
ncbi:hypothetical protein OAA09_00145 [bacterium]|nr:hypothetical protein [bacterium]